MLDRNGLRPARYLITKHDMMVVASEVGVMDFEPNEIKEKGRLQPGKILLIDTEKGEIYYDSELKEQLANAQPYRTWLEKNRVELDELKSGRKIPHKVEKYDKLLRTFGYSREDIERIIVPMCTGRNRSAPWATIRHWPYYPPVRKSSIIISANNSPK